MTGGYANIVSDDGPALIKTVSSEALEHSRVAALRERTEKPALAPDRSHFHLALHSMEARARQCLMQSN